MVSPDSQAVSGKRLEGQAQISARLLCPWRGSPDGPSEPALSPCKLERRPETQSVVTDGRTPVPTILGHSALFFSWAP